ncbi:VOC family protein [Streptomyces sp. NPDC005303]|uniref:VOC family protein n=1 Tax=Streptomyces sp. NPDC005303 TaxID=3155713 RepID=UPI00339DE4E7
MPELDHTIVHSSDRFAGARFIADLLEAPEPKAFGPFAVVRLGNGISLDYAEHLVRGKDWVPGHYAFRVTEEEFDAIFAKIQERDLPYWADPRHSKPQEINHLAGGRGVYIHDPDGHYMEFLTVTHTDEFLTSLTIPGYDEETARS